MFSVVYTIMFQIVLEGVIKSGSRGEIAVDEILLQGGKCQTESKLEHPVWVNSAVCV